MQYLTAADYVLYGLGEDTADDLVTAASAMIDAFCRRTSLMVTQYVERVRLRGGCASQVSYLPVNAVVGVRARTAYAGGHLLMNEALSAFGLAGQWIAVDPGAVSFTPDGVVSITPHIFGVPYTEVEITYTAGFTDVPVPVKVACAQIVKNAQAMPALNVKRQEMDSMRMEYFQGALLDAEVQRLLQPYVAERVG